MEGWCGKEGPFTLEVSVEEVSHGCLTGCSSGAFLMGSLTHVEMIIYLSGDWLIWASNCMVSVQSTHEEGGSCLEEHTVLEFNKEGDQE